MTEEAFRAAYTLARRHGHAWATAFASADEAWALYSEHRSAFDAAVSDHAGDWGGITAPDVVERGHVRHVTGTGRVVWDVSPDGKTEVTVHRPKGMVYVATGTPGGRWRIERATGIFSQVPGARHLRAIAQVVGDDAVAFDHAADTEAWAVLAEADAAGASAWRTPDGDGDDPCAARRAAVDAAELAAALVAVDVDRDLARSVLLG